MNPGVGVIFQKVVWWFLKPTNVLFLALCVAALLLVIGWQRSGKRVLLTTLFVTVLVSLLPTGHLLARPLESYFPKATLPEDITGIIVLGGAEMVRESAANNEPSLNAAAERIIEGITLARQYPDATLVFTGGTGLLAGATISEADVARQFFERFDIDSTRTVYEPRSRNTAENAAFSFELLQPQTGDTWVLITSAMHLPRATATFQAAGWQVLPYPVDYRTTSTMSWFHSPNILANLPFIDDALREWAGLLAYRLTGRTERFLPPRATSN